VLKDADENKDGEISYDEFVILMRKIGEWPSKIDKIQWLKYDLFCCSTFDKE
jgi:hypothetical protein